MSRTTTAPPSGSIRNTTGGNTAFGQAIYRTINPRGITNAQLFFRLICTFVVAGIGWAILFIGGVNVGPTTNVTYPTAAHWSIFVINILFMVSVAIDWIVYRDRPASKLVAPLLMLVGLTLVPLITLIWLFTGPLLGHMVDAGIATSMWLPWIFRLNGVIALLINGWLVWRIWGLGDTDVSGDKLRATVAQHQRLLVPDNDALAQADTRLIAADGVKATRKTEKDKAEKDLKAAQKAKNTAQDNFDKKQKPTLDKAQKTLTDRKDDQKDAEALLDTFLKKPANKALKTSTVKADKAKYKAAKAKLDNDVSDAKTKVIKAKQALKKLKKSLMKTTPEGVALKKAEKDLKAAQKADEGAQTAYSGAKTAAATARAAHEAAQKVVDDRTKGLRSAERGLARHQSALGLNRGRWIGISILLLVVMWLLYSAWPGWVLETYNSLFGVA